AGRRRRSGLGELRTVGVGRAGGVGRERVDLEVEHAIREPLFGDAAQVRRGRGLHLLQAGLEVVRTPGEDLALSQHVRLAAEAADPLDAPYEGRELLGAYALHLGRGEAFGQQLGDLLVDGLLDPGQVPARLRGGDDVEA